MTSRIVCYRLEAKPGPRGLALPVGSEVLAAGYHHGAVGLWVRLSDATEKSDMEGRTFELFETGATFEGRTRYLGTCSAPGGTFCMHVVERLEPGALERDPGRTMGQRVEGLEHDLEEIADNLRGRIEGLESPGGKSIEDLDLDIRAVERARVALAGQVAQGETQTAEALDAIRARLETLEGSGTHESEEAGG